MNIGSKKLSERQLNICFFKISVWVPQCSTLKPLISLIYINDFYKVTGKFDIIHFVGDRNLVFLPKMIATMESINSKIKGILTNCKLTILTLTHFQLRFHFYTP